MTSRLTSRHLISLSAALAFSMFGCSAGNNQQQQHASAEIKLSALIDQTGASASPTHLDAAKLAVKQMNEALAETPALSYLKFNVTWVDSRNDPVNSVTEASKAVKENGSKGLLLDVSATSSAVNKLQYDADENNDLNVPIICASCTASTINNPNATAADPVDQAGLRNGEKWLWKVTASTRVIGKVMSKVLLARGTNGDVNGDGVFKISILQVDDALGRSLAGDITASLKEARSDTVVETILHSRAVESSHNWDVDWQAASDNSSKLADGGTKLDGAADVTTIASFPQQIADATSTWAQNKLTYPPLYQWNSFRIRSVIDTLGEKANGQEGVSYMPNETSTSGTQFATDFKAETGLEPAPRDAYYYDAMVVLMLAAAMQQVETAEGAEVDPAGIRDHMAKTSDASGLDVICGKVGFKAALGAIAEKKAIDYDGATGSVDFDANNAVRNRVCAFKVENGKVVNTTVYDCVTSDDCNPVP